ncbi:hypothetical protein BHU72_07410 [Desulfuribacillus stibiiarsenatis]|uniref:Uncharacterized protein n=1 Tax=Desulfuribacillus stibiiarsenatis TaxID=1390249 RepID=A0A1E5L4G0_9FIRM|nr:hypothetical protein [Desulfuribacillus stibiiarsenatis]OEH85007.1 hypothetical protein BHU72_07410 [Desulfuribacillus stibiiarsenatis]
MDWHELNDLGDQLRDIGHRRRELAEKIVSEVEEGDQEESIHLYQELSSLSNSAIELMTKQKRMIEQKIKRLQ